MCDNFVCRRNQALEFDGSDDYVLLPGVQTLDMDESFTLEAWVYLAADYPSDPMPVFSTANDTIHLTIDDG